MPRGRPNSRRAVSGANNAVEIAEPSILPDNARVEVGSELQVEAEEALSAQAEAALDLEVLQDLNRSRFRNFCDMSLSEGTKRQYGYKIETLKSFLRSEFPNQIDNNNIILPLGENIITAFFGHISFRRSRNGEEVNIDDSGPQTLSHQYISTYRSAIVSEYTRQNCRFPDVEEKILQKFLKGVRNNIATQRESGAMCATEGKSPISIAAFRLLADDLISMEGPDMNLHITCHTYIRCL